MKPIGIPLFPLLRLFVSILLLSCLSPAPESTPKQNMLSAVLDGYEGTLSILIRKSERTLTLYKGGRPVRSYRAAFGGGFGDGDKRMEGDRRTPEGAFYICSMKTSKRFYKFLGISYPSLKHAEYGLQSNLITSAEYRSIKEAIDHRQQPPWGTRLGGAVGIHGLSRNGTASLPPAGMDWTDGCIALDNAHVDELYGVVALGTPVLITP